MTISRQEEDVVFSGNLGGKGEEGGKKASFSPSREKEGEGPLSEKVSA